MYDARGGNNQSNNSMIFGLAVVGVVFAAFTAVLLWPSSSVSEGPTAQIAQEDETDQKGATIKIHAAFESQEERAVATTIADLNPDAYARIETKLAENHVTRAQRDEILLKEFSLIVMENVDVLATADVKHLDLILSDIRSGLQQASRSNSKLCEGATYAALDGMKPKQIEGFMRKELMNNEGVRNFGLKMTGRVLDAVQDARTNPVQHGEMDVSDERAVQGLVMSLVTQPEIMMLAMAANSGAGSEAALASTNICQLSVAALKAVDTLPSGTKGRLWAQAFAEVKKGGGAGFDPNSLAAISGF